MVTFDEIENKQEATKRLKNIAEKYHLALFKRVDKEFPNLLFVLFYYWPSGETIVTFRIDLEKLVPGWSGKIDDAVYERMVSKGIITYYCSPFSEEEDHDEDH